MLSMAFIKGTQVVTRSKLVINIEWCSMSWLKRKLRKLGLKKRCPDPPEEEIKALIQVYWVIYLCTVYNKCDLYRDFWLHPIILEVIVLYGKSSVINTT